MIRESLVISSVLFIVLMPVFINSKLSVTPLSWYSSPLGILFLALSYAGIFVLSLFVWITSFDPLKKGIIDYQKGRKAKYSDKFIFFDWGIRITYNLGYSFIGPFMESFKIFIKN